MTSIETALYTGPSNNAYKSFALSVQPANASVVLSQAHYRWRNDDGAESATSASVSLDAAAVTATTTSNSLTINSVTVPSGNNRLLMVAVCYKPVDSSADVDDVTSVSWNGQSLTRVGFQINSTYAGVSYWYLVNPAVTTSNVDVKLSGSTTYAIAGAIPFSGVSQSTPFGSMASTRNGSQTGSTIATVTQTATTASGEYVFGAMYCSSPAITTITSGTSQWNSKSGTNVGAGGTLLASGTSTTVSWTVTGTSTRYWSIAAVPIKPAAATFAIAEDNKLGIAKSTTKRLRFLVSNLGTGSSSAAYKLRVAETATCGSGSYGGRPDHRNRSLAGGGYNLFCRR